MRAQHERVSDEKKKQTIGLKVHDLLPHKHSSVWEEAR